MIRMILAIAIFFLNISAEAQTDSALRVRVVYTNTILTDKRGNYAEHGGWKKVNYLIDLTDTTNTVILKEKPESYHIKRDTSYYDDFRDWWIDFKCIDAGNNPGHLRLEFYNPDKPLMWDNQTLQGCLYLDFPSITYAYKFVPTR